MVGEKIRKAIRGIVNRYPIRAHSIEEFIAEVVKHKSPLIEVERSIEVGDTFFSDFSDYTGVLAYSAKTPSGRLIVFREICFKEDDINSLLGGASTGKVLRIKSRQRDRVAALEKEEKLKGVEIESTCVNE